MISRILLFIAAMRISAGWAVGVLLPFGPLFFRVKYPEEAKSAVLFRYATLPCFCLYLVMGPGPTLSGYKDRHVRSASTASGQLVHYAIEKRPAPTPPPPPPPTLEERIVANAKEIERLRAVGEALRLRKRDLLHSDVEGNRIYIVDLALYNQAMAKATADKAALTTAK